MKACPNCNGTGKNLFQYTEKQPYSETPLKLARVEACKVCDGSGQVEGDAQSATGDSSEPVRPTLSDIRNFLEQMHEYGHGLDEWHLTREAMERVLKLAIKAEETTRSEIAPSDACRAALANIMARIDGDEFIPTEYKEDARKALASVPSATPCSEYVRGLEDAALLCEGKACVWPLDIDGSRDSEWGERYARCIRDLNPEPQRG